MKTKYIYFAFNLFILCFISIDSLAQKLERDFIRKGNRQLKDSITIGAEISYMSALQANPSSNIAKYNLASSLIVQNKTDEAMKMLKEVVDSEKDKSILAKSYHNIGVINHLKKDYANAVKAYVQSLKNNPKDDETRYNLAVAKRFLNQQKNNDDKNNNKDNNKDNKQDNQNKKDDDKDNKEQKNDRNQQENKQQENEISKENAEQILEYVRQKEKETNESMKKTGKSSKRRNEKDW